MRASVSKAADAEARALCHGNSPLFRMNLSGWLSVMCRTTNAGNTCPHLVENPVSCRQNRRSHPLRRSLSSAGLKRPCCGRAAGFNVSPTRKATLSANG
jgi:hypothetical protein